VVHERVFVPALDVGRGDSSSNSTLEKLTSTLDTCQPDDEAETQKADTSSAVSAKENDRIVENKVTPLLRCGNVQVNQSPESHEK
jgi:hypothetical protein